MARIKFTGPVSTVQLQPTPILQGLVSKGDVSAQTESQADVENISRSIVEESTSLKQQQSLELVQIMLHVSFILAFSHMTDVLICASQSEFLPLSCFNDRDLKEAQRENTLSYREFIDGKPRPGGTGALSQVAFGTGRRGQPLKIIVRDSDPKANMILDVLENGIFDALKKNVLGAIQFTILVDKDKPENVLESYTFTFKYSRGSGGVNSRLESLSINPVGCVADLKSAQTARVGLETIIRRLITLSTFLPNLPNKRNLGIHLFYTDDCPPEYEPPGFTGAMNDTIKYPLNENWRKETQSCGAMNSGWHTVGLKVTSLKWTGPDPEGSEVVPKVPMDLEYRDVVRRSEDIGLAEERIIDDDLKIQSVRSTDMSQEATQDITEREKLQMMIPTQRTSPLPDSELVPTQPINPRAAVDHASKGDAHTGHGTILSQKKVAEIQTHVRPRDSTLSEGNENQQSVRCQCGWHGEEQAMIECTFCHLRQHAACYGFDGSDDPRIPDVHACYQCLLEPKEVQLLCEMTSLVLLRRALKIIMEEGYPSHTSLFTQKLHCNGQTVIQITDILRKQNILQPTPGYKQKGFLRKGLPKFKISPSVEIQQKMKEEILNPMAKIRHHYVLKASASPLEASNPRIDQLDSSVGPASRDQPLVVGANVGKDQETPKRAESLDKSPEENSARKRKQLLQNNENEYDSDDLDRNSNQPSTQAQAIDTHLGGAHELRDTPVDNSMTFQKQAADSPSSSEGALRRSSRKRRKISNYSRLIDIGAATSEDERLL
ncbi:putative meiosis specific protein Hop1 [Aspergillus thermomutatus]|uniref:HORMA domain-containing protein n=1 Tax=Aspergillus thermomutatus TaxID=41047 RepID=A0A397HSM5_ASPTH|nr:uncharacterized protein CDV56_109047 [Aspergillus thermomutatus]RHZ65847.1 hypothetical protein CDV56_109047 [Aspergillus thermomutatus]